MRIPGDNTVIAVLVLLGLLLHHFHAEASVPNTLQQDLALRIQCMPEGEAAEGVAFRLFYLARKKNGKYRFTKPYAEIGLSDNPFRNSSESIRAVEVLEQYIYEEGIEEDYAAESNQYGQALVEDMAAGLYLVLSDTVFTLPGGEAYTPVPFLFYLDADLLGKAGSAARDTGDAYTVIAKFAVENGERIPSNGSGGSSSTGIPMRLSNGGIQGAGENTEDPGDPGILLTEDGVPLANGSPEGDGDGSGRASSPPKPRSWDADSPMPQTGLLWWPAPIGFSLGSAMVWLARKRLKASASCLKNR